MCSQTMVKIPILVIGGTPTPSLKVLRYFSERFWSAYYSVERAVWGYDDYLWSIAVHGQGELATYQEKRLHELFFDIYNYYPYICGDCEYKEWVKGEIWDMQDDTQGYWNADDDNLVLFWTHHLQAYKSIKDVEEWRPQHAHIYPLRTREAMRTLLLLAKCTHTVELQI